MGMAKERGRREGENVDGAGIGSSTNTVKDTMMYPGSGLSGEITPLLLLVSSISMNWTTITASLSTQGKVRAAVGKSLSCLPEEELLAVYELSEM